MKEYKDKYDLGLFTEEIKALTGKESGPDMNKLLPLLQTIRLLN